MEVKLYIFLSSEEADITFLPTYRLERNLPGNKYAWRKVKATGVSKLNHCNVYTVS